MIKSLWKEFDYTNLPTNRKTVIWCCLGIAVFDALVAISAISSGYSPIISITSGVSVAIALIITFVFRIGEVRSKARINAVERDIAKLLEDLKALNSGYLRIDELIEMRNQLEQSMTK